MTKSWVWHQLISSSIHHIIIFPSSCDRHKGQEGRRCGALTVQISQQQQLPPWTHQGQKALCHLAITAKNGPKLPKRKSQHVNFQKICAIVCWNILKLCVWLCMCMYVYIYIYRNLKFKKRESAIPKFDRLHPSLDQSNEKYGKLKESLNGFFPSHFCAAEGPHQQQQLRLLVDLHRSLRRIWSCDASERLPARALRQPQVQEGLHRSRGL